MPGKTCLPRKVFPVYHEGSVWMRQAVADILAGVVNHYWPPDRCPDTHLGGLVMELSRPDRLRCTPCHLAAATTECSRCQQGAVVTAFMNLTDDTWLAINFCPGCARLEMLR